MVRFFFFYFRPTFPRAHSTLVVTPDDEAHVIAAPVDF